MSGDFVLETFGPLGAPDMKASVNLGVLVVPQSSLSYKAPGRASLGFPDQ